MNLLQSIPRPEHPRPDFMRDTFINLNGVWHFAFDDSNLGLAENWVSAPNYPNETDILVPFCYQSKASGLGYSDRHSIMWYRRIFVLPQEMCGKRVLLRFGAVDEACIIYVNGKRIGDHQGGYLPFAMDITTALHEGENDLRLRVEDSDDCAQPRGKQYWGDGLMGCWYTPCSGIWQTVYLEAVGAHALKRIKITPNIDDATAMMELSLDNQPQTPLHVLVNVCYQGVMCCELSIAMCSRRICITLPMREQGQMQNIHLWSPQHPALYDAVITVQSSEGVEDCVHTYFGMRSVELYHGRILLNHSPIYQRLILDQGYWPDTMLTPPSDEAIQKDIALTLQLGYNGARKHQKIEDPRYYYHADRMGLLVWGELPSSYEFCDEMITRQSRMLADFIQRDYNHPSIICWTVLNESWGVPNISTNLNQQQAARLLYRTAKALDDTRLVSGNDGWEQVETDICALHDYAADEPTLSEHFADRERVENCSCDFKLCWAKDNARRGDEAFMVTEYGGIAFVNIGLQGEMGGMQTWGYHDKVTDEECFFKRFEETTNAIQALPYCQGYCYTQLTDVMQEINGLLTPDRKPKIDVDRLAAINRNARRVTNEC